MLEIFLNSSPVHTNGCGPKPENCHSAPAPLSAYRDWVDMMVIIPSTFSFWCVVACAMRSDSTCDRLTELLLARNTLT